MNKKQSEREILTLAYSESEYTEIISSERPDFRIRNEDSGAYFGVEITEAYLSESNARVRNVPGYVDEIINHNHYRHKKDKKDLKVVEITITTADGKPKGNARVILMEQPSIERYINVVADTIAAKNARFNEYVRDLTHVNLIIFDTEYMLRKVSIGDFYSYFFTTPLKTALYSSQFREIFFITILEEDRRVYIPLKMLLLLADFYMFAEVMLNYPWETTKNSLTYSSEQDTSTAKLMLRFANYMKVKTDKILFRKEAEQIEVIFGNSGLVLKDGHVTIRDYNDFPLPADAQGIEDNDLTNFFSSPEFREVEQKILDRGTFYAEIAYDVKGDLEF